MKRTSTLRLDAAALRELAAPAMVLARAEGLTAHERSVGVSPRPLPPIDIEVSMFEPPASDANPKARLTAITLDEHLHQTS